MSIRQQREEILVEIVTVVDDIVVNQPVDVINQEADIKDRVDEVAAGIALVDGVVFRVAVAIQGLGSLLEASEAIALQEPAQHRMIEARPQINETRYLIL